MLLGILKSDIMDARELEKELRAATAKALVSGVRELDIINVLRSIEKDFEIGILIRR